MAGFYLRSKHRVNILGGQSICGLVGQSCVRVPRALVRYWLIFAVGFVVGGVMNQRPLSRVEQLEQIASDEIKRQLQVNQASPQASDADRQRISEAVRRISSR